MTQTAILIAIGLAAFVVGGGLGFMLAARRGRHADERAERVQAELAAYRGNVTEHFRETAVKFRELTEQYRSLHQHLAEGAEARCEVPGKGPKLEFAPLAELEGPQQPTATAGGEDGTTDDALVYVSGEGDREAAGRSPEDERPAETPAAASSADIDDTAERREETEVAAEEESKATAAPPPAETMAPVPPVDFAVEPEEAEREKAERERREPTIH
jgi:hypothetical protein